MLGFSTSVTEEGTEGPQKGLKVVGSFGGVAYVTSIVCVSLFSYDGVNLHWHWFAYFRFLSQCQLLLQFWIPRIVSCFWFVISCCMVPNPAVAEGSMSGVLLAYVSNLVVDAPPVYIHELCFVLDLGLSVVCSRCLEARR